MIFSRRVYEVRLNVNEMKLFVEGVNLDKYITSFDEVHQQWITILSNDDIVEVMKSIDNYCNNLLLEEKLGFEITKEEVDIYTTLTAVYKDLDYLLTGVDDDDDDEYDDDFFDDEDDIWL